MAQIYYLHHYTKEVKIYSYRDLDFYTHRNYPQHNLKELVKLIQSLKLFTSLVLTNDTVQDIFKQVKFPKNI